MAIKTPKFLPGERGYIPKRERTKKQKEKEKKGKKAKKRRELFIGKIKIGKGIRLGRPVTNPRKEKKYIIWKYKKKIGEMLVKNKDTPEEKIILKFNRFGGIGSFKHLIQDSDFQLDWMVREQELLMTQKFCFLCRKNISKTAKPNLYHTKMWKKRVGLLEEAETVPEAVVEGKLSIENGWKKFSSILEKGNRYYMSLKDTALVCAACAKIKNLDGQ